MFDVFQIASLYLKCHFIACYKNVCLSHQIDCVPVWDVLLKKKKNELDPTFIFSFPSEARNKNQCFDKK